MKRDFSGEVKSLIQKYDENDIKYGKSLNYLLFRNKITEEEIKKELSLCENLEFAEKQKRENETRYLLYFVYSKKRGRAYALKFNNKIKIITIFPLGRRTLKKYSKKRFKK